MTLSAEQRAVVNEAKRILREERKAATKARPKSPKATRGRDIDNGFLAYLRRQPCEARRWTDCSGPIDAAHIRFNDGPDRQNPGGSRKNHDRHANPLCREHHTQQHSVNERQFWSALGKDAYETAAAHYAAYQGQADSGKAGLAGYGADEIGGMHKENKDSQ
jgi:hypothetical protein